MPLLRLLLLLALCLPALAAEPRANPSPADSARTLVLDNRPIFLFLAPQARLSPEQRLRRTLERIRELTPDDLSQPVQAAPLADSSLRASR